MRQKSEIDHKQARAMALLLASHEALRASLADAQTNAARFSALAALCDRKAGAIRMRRWVGSTREDVITSSAALATVADELRKERG